MGGVIWRDRERGTCCVTRFDSLLCARAGLVGLLETIARGDGLELS